MTIHETASSICSTEYSIKGALEHGVAITTTTLLPITTIL